MDMEREAELRKHRCCFTGHRPEKLVWVSEQSVKRYLTKSIKQAIEDGYVTFLTGMSRGVDLWAAEIVLQLRCEMKRDDIHLIAVMPFPNFEKEWSEDWKRLYNAILDEADIKTYMKKYYSNAAYRLRNEYMVNRCNRIIAYYNQQSGGTEQTIKYAHKQGIEITLPDTGTAMWTITNAFQDNCAYILRKY
jgi:uncharacterized phage-like protein YoqJ